MAIVDLDGRGLCVDDEEIPISNWSCVCGGGLKGDDSKYSEVQCHFHRPC